MRARITPSRFTLVASTALFSLGVIVLTGALVRLTGSGLGCDDWPACNSTRFVDVSTGHAAIEQVNRLFTGVVSAAVIAAVLTAHFREPRRRDLVVLSWALVGGVLAQVVIGGIVVLTGLHPLWNIAHFAVSLLLVTVAFLLVRASGAESVRAVRREVPGGVKGLHRLVLAAVVVAVGTGTVVTGAGPHAGDETAVRLGFALRSVARVHSLAVIVAVVLLARLLWLLRSETTGPGRSMRDAAEMLGFAALVQGAAGYLQYFTGVPVVLVAFHVAGAVGVWLAACNLAVAPQGDSTTGPPLRVGVGRDC